MLEGLGSIYTSHLFWLENAFLKGKRKKTWILYDPIKFSVSINRCALTKFISSQFQAVLSPVFSNFSDLDTTGCESR